MLLWDGRQYMSLAGKITNCQICVFAAYVPGQHARLHRPPARPAERRPTPAGPGSLRGGRRGGRNATLTARVPATPVVVNLSTCSYIGQRRVLPGAAAHGRHRIQRGAVAPIDVVQRDAEQGVTPVHDKMTPSPPAGCRLNGRRIHGRLVEHGAQFDGVLWVRSSGLAPFLPGTEALFCAARLQSGCPAPCSRSS